MDRWFTARDLAALALPGLPKNVGSIKEHMQRAHAWDAARRPFIQRVDYPGRRGRKPIAIHFRGLPRPARDELFGRAILGVMS